MNREILFPTPVYFKMVKDPQKLNKYLFDYLTKVNKTNNDLYSKLGSMQND